MTYRFRWVLWPILVIGAVLVIAPFAMSLPSKASAGQKLLNDFHPIMQPAAVRTTVAYDKVFQDLRPVALGATAASPEIPGLFSTLASSLHVSQTELVAFLRADFPAMAKMLQTFPQLVPVFKKVPPGLNWYAPIVNTMQANVSNYAKVDSLPNFNLFTSFFVVPGGLLVIFGALGIFAAYRPRRSRAAQVVPVSSVEKAA